MKHNKQARNKFKNLSPSSKMSWNIVLKFSYPRTVLFYQGQIFVVRKSRHLNTCNV